SMDYSIPIFCNRHADEHIVGILVASIDLHNSLFKMLLERVGLGKTGETLIVNKDLVALNELRWHDNAPLNLQISAKPAVNAARGETGIAVTTDYRGERILAAYTYIPETGWGFVCKQDLYELNAPIREMVWNFIIIFIIISIVIALIAFKISQTISKPIVEIDNVAQRFGAGDFSVRNTIASEDELGSLAMEFNNMADVTESRLKIQKGVADISETMIGQSSLQEFGPAVLKQLIKITKANTGIFYILNETTSKYEYFASVGANEELLKPFDAKNPEGEVGNALSEKSIYYLRDIPEDTIFKYRTTAGDAIPKEIITIPILVDNTVVAIISLVNIHRFSKECYEILKQSWAGINTSYSNLMASETRILAEQLTKINKQLEAQTEELQGKAKEMSEQAEELQCTSEELQEKNIELEAQRKQVEAANQLKSEFLSNMSHELRTPLNSILALSRVLIIQAKNKLNDEENNYLEIVERNGKRLLSLINDILDLSKIEAGKMEISPKSVSIVSLLRIIKENMQTLLEEKGLSLTLRIPENLPQVESEESKLHQVLTNIISNAVKFTGEGSVDISVTFDTMNVFIEVKDSGIGISEEMLPHIFDEFRQADGTSSRQYEGTGLGLAIANKLMKILGGNIKVKSKLGKGSVFTVTIPIKWHEGTLPTETFRFKDKPSEPMDKMILVVDDDPKIVKDISEYLNEAGYKTMEATSGKEALELAWNYQPFAITLDIIMPEMDGWEVLQKLKTNARTKNIPVIVISVSNDKDTGFALGAVGYVNKPVDKDLLISEIKILNKTPNLVMIVDDNEFELKQMAEIIETEDINTILATCGKECIKLLEEKVPDILVLDIMMPGMDGFKVLEEIRKKPETRDLPVIIITAKDLTKEDKTKLIGRVSAIIAKSGTTPQDLYKEIKRIIENLEDTQKTEVSIKINNEPRILVVEDNPDNMTTIKAILKDKYHIVEALDGEQGLKIAQSQQPDLILLDMSLPKISGEKIVEILKADDKTKHIPIIAVTAQAMLGDKERFIKAGCDGYISKPMDVEALLAEIGKFFK
ncbi:MAG: response regulator, partial [Chlorobi bacterium]|nr:response regulator [Chlorobiota bacterium]